jgi:hydrogenase small subunit/[NiFe] hydrogenase small subunit
MKDKAANVSFSSGLSRRGFLKSCTLAATALGLSEAMIPKLIEAAESAQRPTVIWLHFQECTGCTETLLRGSHPDIGRLILDIISLDYHETVMVPSGHQAEKSLHDSVAKNKGKFVLVVEGAIPTADNGNYCKIAGRTAVDILEDIGPQAAAIIAMGTCASFGGIQAAHPNPTGAKGVQDIVSGVPILNLPGCPPNPITFLGTVLHFLTFKRLPTPINLDVRSLHMVAEFMITVNAVRILMKDVLPKNSAILVIKMATACIKSAVKGLRHSPTVRPFVSMM